METTIHNRSEVLREIEIFVGEDELKAAFDAAYQQIRPKMALPGFRAGKAPLSLIKKMHGDAIEGDTMERLAQDKFKSAVEEHNLQPIGTPVMTDLHRHAGEGAHFKISYEVKPEITLNDYEGTEIEQPTYAITDTDVEERLHFLRFNYSTKEAAQKIEDKEAVASLQFTDRSKPEAPPETTSVYLHDPQLVPALGEALIGKSVGDTFEIDLPQTINGEQQITPVSIVVQSIEKVTLPEVDEEFAKKISRDKATNEDEVRAMVREELELNAKRRSDEALESNMVNALLSKHEFQVPRTYTYALLDAMIKEVKDENVRRGFPENYNLDEEEYRKAAWNNAEVRAKWLLLRDKLVEAMDLQATEEDLKAQAATDAAQYGIAAENLEKYYLSNEEIKERIRSQKLVEKLKQQFVVKEKPVTNQA